MEQDYLMVSKPRWPYAFICWRSSFPTQVCVEVEKN